MKYTKYILFVLLSLFLTVNTYSQIVTNSATLYGVVKEQNGNTVTVPIPLEVVRTNGMVMELRLNITNVSQNATTLNLSVYNLIYTTNVVETPVTNNNGGSLAGTGGTTTGGTTTGGTTTGGTTGTTTGGTTTGGTTTGGTTTGGTTGTTTGGTTGTTTGGTTGTTTGGTTTGGTTTSSNTVTNDVTLLVTMQLDDNSTNQVNLPAKTVWTDNKLSNIIFDVSSVPPNAVILRVRILDYIYDPQGNLIGPVNGGTNTNGSGTGTGSGTSSGGGSGTGGTGSTSTNVVSANSVQFPVEVLGADQTVEEFKFVLNDNLNDIYGAQFTIHGLGYTNKASVSINGSQWIPLNNRTVFFPKKFDRVWVGIGGIHSTLTMVLPFASNNIVAGITNTIKFKFNDTTKQTIGYRVLNADIVRREDTGEVEKTFGHRFPNNSNPNPNTPGGFYTNKVYRFNPVTLATTKIVDNPKNWTPMSTDPAVIDQGKDLWFNGNISERGVALNSKCTDCHFTDGYDLKYFNYSDKSIIARSKYHGLSEQQGVALAAYIRSLDVPYQEKGRPWNPLYQPGPGQSTVPIDSWVAGAGMEWVLDDDIKSFQYIFPNGPQNGIKYNDVLQPIDFKKSYNINDIPIAMQMPDWNQWLPVAHLKDSAPEAWAFSLTNSASAPGFFSWFTNSVPRDKGLFGLVRYMRSASELNGYNLFHMDQKFQKGYIDSGKGTYYQNKVRMAFRHWITVRNLELMQRWKMQDLGHDILEDNANTRDQWGERGARMYMDLGKLDKIKAQFGSSWTNVFNDRRWFANTWPFHLAPHIGGLWPVTDQNNPEFTYEPFGDRSPQWYQLQMYLDDSNRMPEYNIIDWGYIHNFLYGGTSQWGTAAQYALYTSKHNAIQFLNTLKTYEAFQFNNEYNGLIEGRWTDYHPHIRLLNGTLFIGDPNSADYNKFNEFTVHFIDPLSTKEKRDLLVGVYNQIFKAQIARLEEYPSAASYDITVNSENGLRYLGCDPALIQRFVDFRNKTWPDKPYTSKVTHVWPQPFYPAL